MPRAILIADDSEAIRRATRDFLERRTEFKVCGEAVDGFDALDKACDLKPDLVILDLSMPRMNGLQAAYAIRRVLCDVPIILFTMYADAI
jgi:DNA-binding NarL/FixJ family response regulator